MKFCKPYWWLISFPLNLASIWTLFCPLRRMEMWSKSRLDWKLLITPHNNICNNICHNNICNNICHNNIYNNICHKNICIWQVWEKYVRIIFISLPWYLEVIIMGRPLWRIKMLFQAFLCLFYQVDIKEMIWKERKMQNATQQTSPARLRSLLNLEPSEP